MKELPSNVIAYKKTKIFNRDTIPKSLLKDHSTKDTVWGKICVLEGELLYTIINTRNVYTLSPKVFGVVEPQVIHKVAPLGKVRFYVEFYK